LKNKDFWELIIRKKISLISKEESDYSIVKAEEAKAFILTDQILTKPVVPQISTDVQINASDDDMDHDASSLFDLIE